MLCDCHFRAWDCVVVIADVARRTSEVSGGCSNIQLMARTAFRAAVSWRMARGTREVQNEASWVAAKQGAARCRK